MVNHDLLWSYYKGMKVMVTGHTGFKGTWLSAILNRLGASVKGYALEPEESKPFYDLFAKSNALDSVIGDIRDKDKFHREIISFEPDYIFHLAAQPLVLRSYQIPAETFEVNVTGTANLLESLINLDKKCAVVVVTTDKVYENNERSKLFEETDKLGGSDPYSASKACAELVVESFRQSFFNSNEVEKHKKGISSARAGNVVGGGDWSENRLLPDVIKSLQKNKPVFVRNPVSVRPWQHVLEPLCGYLLLGALLYREPLKYSKAYNFGPLADDHLSVLQLVEHAIESWGSGEYILDEKKVKPKEAGMLQLSIKKAISELNWHPKLNVKEAIDWSIDWYKQSRETQAAFTFEQIDNYLRK